MKYPVQVGTEAERDIEEILAYLDDQVTGLSATFLLDYEELLVHLASYASSVQSGRNGYRHVLVGRFRILLIYQFNGECVLIWRLIHAARNPDLRFK